MTKVRSETKSACEIGVSSFLAYAGCYMGKNILSAMLPQMISENVCGRTTLAAMGSAFFVAYGVGELVNGLIGNRISAKYMVFWGLFLSGLLCLLFPVLFTYSLGFFIWSACGFLCSMLWGPISKLVGENTSKKIGVILLTLLTVASIVGTAVTYLFAVVSAVWKNWKLGFFITGISLTVLALFWYVAVETMERKKIVRQQKTGKVTSHVSIAAVLLNNGFIPMTIVAMLNGIIRNAVAFWIPTFITERLFVSVAAATGISSILPVLNLIGTLASVYLVKCMSGDEKKGLTIFFAFTTLMFCIMWLLQGRRTVLNIVTLFCASAAMTGACNLIFTYYVLRFTKTEKISGITGFLDFASYVSASAANILFSFLVSEKGWDFVVGIWGLVALAGTAFSWYAMRFPGKKCFMKQ